MKPVVPADVAEALPAIIADAEEQLQPMDEQQMDTELMALLAVLGVGVPQDEKTEFVLGASVHLSRYPAKLCAEALHEAVRNRESLRTVIGFVDAYCEDYPKRMNARLERLRRLDAIAKGTPDV